MQVELTNHVYDFSPWRPECGRVFSRTFAFDAETTLIDRARSWLVPAFVIGAAFDGQRGVFITREHLAAFFLAHDGLAFVAHHAPFDVGVVRAAAPELEIDRWIDRRRVWCTRILYQLLMLGTAGHTADGKGRTTLDRLARKFLGIEVPKGVRDATGKPVRLSYGQWLGRPARDIEPIYLEYLARDVIATWQLYVRLRRRLRSLRQRSAAEWGFVSSSWLETQTRKWGPQTHHIQLRAAVALDIVSANGLHIDPDCRGELADALQVERERLRSDLAAAGYLPGKGSTRALQAILARIERRQPDRPLPRTATGKYACGAAALRELAAEVPFVGTLLSFRAADKLLTTFLDKLAKPTVHPSFRTLTRSGRTSSFGELNAQNLPRDERVRNCFTPSPGHVFVTADYSTIELVTLAQACSAQFGLDSCMEKAIAAGRDLHRLVAARLMGKAEADVTDSERSRAKPVNFGKPGGMGLTSLRSYAKMSYDLDLSEGEVQSLSDAWFAEFPEMHAFLADDREAQWRRVADLCKLTPAMHEATTGTSCFAWRAAANGTIDQSNPYLGAMLLKVMGRPEPRTSTGEPYSESDIEFFWSRAEAIGNRLPAWARTAIGRREPSSRLRRAVLALSDRAGVFTLTGRLRAKATYCQRHNAVFQGLAADGAKLALWKLLRAGYRVVNFVHDEFVVEIPTDDESDRHVRRIKQLMIRGMQAVVPDLPIAVKAAAGARWGKP